MIVDDTKWQTDTLLYIRPKHSPAITITSSAGWLVGSIDQRNTIAIESDIIIGLGNNGAVSLFFNEYTDYKFHVRPLNIKPAHLTMLMLGGLPPNFIDNIKTGRLFL